MAKISPYAQRTEAIDRIIHAWMGQATLSLSPASLMLAFADWFAHFTISPGKQLELFENALFRTLEFCKYASQAAEDPEQPPFIRPLPQDHRFRDPDWQRWPFNLIHQWFLLAEQWWNYATTEVRGVSKHHQDVVSFVVRQILDVFAPSNYPFTNPEVLRATIQRGGTNFIQGLANFVRDWHRTVRGEKPEGSEAFEVGKNVAVTAGKVVYRNRLIELIQYAPTTDKVYAEPVLIIPAWIMKYYILDLSPHNSLVKYLVDNGHTVFMISWKNPGSEDRDLGMEDYRKLGVMAALDAISAILPDRKVHALGYCIGGTLLTIAIATMAHNGDNRLRSLTLLATQTDFTDAGELTLFIDESQVTYLEDIMWEKGYLDSRQMSAAFQLIRSNDLIWSRIIRDYLLGERTPMFDLMAWNADGTRMPYRMHRECLRKLFLNDDLAEGHYEVERRKVVVSDIRVPVFLVAAVSDHVAPWRSVYKFHLLSDTQVTFLLTSGGHNAGILSEPGHPRRTYQMTTREDVEFYIDPDQWRKTTPVLKGSWWPVWRHWLVERSTGPVPPPSMGDPDRGFPPLADAPGMYVLEP